MAGNLKDELASLRIDSSARAGGRRRGTWILLLALVAAVVAGGWVWASRHTIPEVATERVSTPPGGATAAAAVLNASGYVTARRRATVSSKVTGKVVEVRVEEGQAVREGQVLARLDDSQIRAALAVAEAQLAAARRAAAEDQARLREALLTLERQRELVKEQVISRAELDAAEAQVESLRARIAYAEQQVNVAEQQVKARQVDLADTVVRAPFDGVAISKDAQPGEMISPVSAGGGFTRTGICTLVDMSSLEIEVDVSESYINRVYEHQPVEAVLDAYPDWQIPAHVITTVPSADRQKATVRVRIGFGPPAGESRARSTGPDSSGVESGTPRSTGSRSPRARSGELDPRILPDMGVKVSFLAERTPEPEGAPEKPALMVPKAAVRTDNGTTVVFVVRDGQVERRAVKVAPAAQDAGQVAVTSGLNAGERVVVEGPPTLGDGARVKER